MNKQPVRRSKRLINASKLLNNETNKSLKISGEKHLQKKKSPKKKSSNSKKPKKNSSKKEPKTKPKKTKRASKKEVYKSNIPLHLRKIRELKTKYVDLTIDDLIFVYPGRFQPFHKGHFKVYSTFSKKYPNVIITTSDKQGGDKHPLNFEEKKNIMTNLFGIDESNIMKGSRMYYQNEILEHIRKNKEKFSKVKNPIIIYIVSQKDMIGKEARFKFNNLNYIDKKTGLKFKEVKGTDDLEYVSIQKLFIKNNRILSSDIPNFNNINIKKINPYFNYLTVAPVERFKLLGRDIDSATTIRELIKQGREKAIQVMEELYNTKYSNYPDIFDLIIRKINN